MAATKQRTPLAGGNGKMPGRRKDDSAAIPGIQRDELVAWMAAELDRQGFKRRQSSPLTTTIQVLIAFLGFLGSFTAGAFWVGRDREKVQATVDAIVQAQAQSAASQAKFTVALNDFGVVVNELRTVVAVLVDRSGKPVPTVKDKP